MKRYFLTTSVVLSTFCLAFIPYRASAQSNCIQYSGNYDDNSDVTYVGRLCDGEPNGHGTLTGINRGKYVGQFKEGEYHGSGTLTYFRPLDDHPVKYVGQFRDGEYHGSGTLNYVDWKDNPEKYVGQFEEGKYHGSGTRSYVRAWDGQISAKYIGMFVDGSEEGQGRLELANGSWYEGTFEDGDFVSGRGHQVLEDGIYDGEFEDDRYHGLGTLNYVRAWDGFSEKYIGMFVDGSEEGQGRLEFDNGSWYEGTFEDGDFVSGRGHEVLEDEIYDGEFKDDEYHGLGTYTYVRTKDDISAKYIGMFVDGFEEGEGRLELANGSWYEGTFEDGDFVSGSSHVVSEDKIYEDESRERKITNSGGLTDIRAEENELPAEISLSALKKITVSDRDAQPLVRIPPIVPPRFSQGGDHSGFCKVLFDVSPEGQPFNVQTTLCTSVLLERATIRAVQKWKYNPKIVDHQAVPRTGVETTVRFQLQDERGRLLPLPPGY